jgi:hypothetical protein
MNNHSDNRVFSQQLANTCSTLYNIWPTLGGNIVYKDPHHSIHFTQETMAMFMKAFG